MRKPLKILVSASSLALAAALAASPLTGVGALVIKPIRDLIANVADSDLAKATAATKTAREDYTAARKVWEDRLKTDEATLLKDDGFPKPVVDDPLKTKRDALTAAKTNLATLVTAATTPASGTTGTPTTASVAAPDPKELEAAKTELTGAGNALKDEAADKKLVSDGTTALAKALANAIEAAVGKDDEAKDEESEVAAARVLAASTTALTKLSALEARLAYLPPYKEPAAGVTDGPPNVVQKLADARKKLKEVRGPQVGDLAGKAKDQLAAVEKDQRTYLEKQADGPAAARRNISARRRVVAARDLVTAINGVVDALKSDKLTAAAAPLDAEIKSLQATVALVDDDLGGGSDTWVQKAIPVYYFGSVPRLITALNLDATRFESDFFRDLDSAATARKALLDNEDARDQKRAERNDLIATLAQMRTQIQAAKARHNLDIARLATLKGQQANLDNAVKDENAKTKPDAAKVTILQKKLDDVNDQVTAAQAKDDAGKDAIDRQQDAITALEAKVPDVEKKLSDAVAEVNKLRIANARLAAAEVDAFLQTEVHRPFWYARPYKGSNDPVKRCAIFGYDDALVMFVRGEPKDVEHVLEVVAAFDRPAPQARVTLHTLQFNGTDPKRLAEATGNVERSLNELRGNLTLVQDALRNAISKEVNRQARVARHALSNGENAPAFSERVFRGFYYPREIREALGLRARTEDVTLPGKESVGKQNLRYRLASAIDDLEEARANFALAQRRYHDATQLLSDHNAVDSAMVETENALVAAANSFSHFAEYAQEAYGTPNALDSEQTKKAKGAWATLLRAGTQISLLVRYDLSFHGLHRELKSILGTEEDKANEQDDQNPPSETQAPVIKNELKVPYTEIVRSANELLEDMQNDLTGLGDKGLPKANSQDALEDPAFIESTEYITRYTLPDPARGTTLGELLFVFSLGGQDSRARILRDFSSELLDNVRVATSGRSRRTMREDASVAQKWLEGGALTNDPGNGLSRNIATIYAFAADTARLYGNPVETTVPRGSNSLFPYFPRTVFGGFSPRAHPGPSEEPMTANQLEILTAIEARVKIGALAQAYGLVADENAALDEDAKQQLLWLTGYVHGLARKGPPSTDDGSSKDSSTISQSFAQFAPPNIKNATSSLDGLRALDALRGEVAPEESLGRAAAADDMIKRFVTVLEDDLQHYLVDPALQNARNAVNGKGSRFANFQSTSILASNRSVARFDASAVATLGTDPNAGADAAMAAQQLSDVVSGLQGGEEARRAGGIAPFVGPALLYNRDPKARGDKLLAQGALGLLVSSLLIPDETVKGDLYSLTSGGEFKLTPVFDPSGQALRFNFDYALSTRVLDPLGGQGVELPRIERQSFNTEIQITNLEFRRVAEFSSNTRIGVPERRSGGFPVLKELPVFKDIPLLGYFVRSRGTSAVRQQSYVFAQTSLYPTVSDIVNLLVASPLRSLPSSRVNRQDAAAKKENR